MTESNEINQSNQQANNAVQNNNLKHSTLQQFNILPTLSPQLQKFYNLWAQSDITSIDLKYILLPKIQKDEIIRYQEMKKKLTQISAQRDSLKQEKVSFQQEKIQLNRQLEQKTLKITELQKGKIDQEEIIKVLNIKITEQELKKQKQTEMMQKDNSKIKQFQKIQKINKQQEIQIQSLNFHLKQINKEQSKLRITYKLKMSQTQYLHEQIHNRQKNFNKLKEQNINLRKRINELVEENQRKNILVEKYQQQNKDQQQKWLNNFTNLEDQNQKLKIQLLKQKNETKKARQDTLKKKYTRSFCEGSNQQSQLMFKSEQNKLQLNQNDRSI